MGNIILQNQTSIGLSFCQFTSILTKYTTGIFPVESKQQQSLKLLQRLLGNSYNLVGSVDHLSKFISSSPKLSHILHPLIEKKQNFWNGNHKSQFDYNGKLQTERKTVVLMLTYKRASNATHLHQA